MGRGHRPKPIDEEARVVNYRPPQVTDEHLGRLAAVYARQSSPAQARDNVGSALIQRDLVNVPRSLGWPEHLIQIRDDLGSSADEPGSREEFERLLRDMAAGRVGAVFVSQFSRLGRNEIDQAFFAQTARLYNVLLFVGTTVYDFRDPNSAYSANMLGFGAVHEHRVRIGLGREARRRKAEHGLEPTAPPIGFVKARGGPYVKTDDDRVREVIQLVWDTFFQLRSGRAVVRHLRRCGIQLPRRVWGGVAWRDATWTAVEGILKSPAYAGIYVYGKTRIVEELDRAGRVRKRQVPVPRSEWLVKEGLHTGYVTPAQFAEAQEILAANRLVLRRPAGRGEALLQGLVRCAVHMRTLCTIYDRRERLADGTVRRPARYICLPGTGTGVHVGCCSVSARRLDPLVEAVVFARLGPAALDEIEEGFQEELRQHEALVRAQEDELRRAERRAAELEREYLATAAEHPHVKDRLRVLWEEARARVEELKTKAALEPATPPERLSDQETAEFRQLVSDLPRLWRHSSVTAVQRKTVLRLLVKDVVLRSAAHELEVTVRWAAGGSDRITALNAAGAATLAEEWHRKGRSRAEIAAGLTEARATTLPGEPGYTLGAARHLVRRIRRERGFEEAAYRFIYEKVLAGTRYSEIAGGLIAAGIPPRLGGVWTADRVGRAVYRMQRTAVFGLPLLPRPPRLRDEVKRLAEAGAADAAEILSRLAETGCLTQRRRQPSLERVQQLLRQLGLSVSSPRPGSGRKPDAVQDELPLPGGGDSSTADGSTAAHPGTETAGGSNSS